MSIRADRQIGARAPPASGEGTLAPPSRPRDRSNIRFLLAVFAAVAIAVVISSVVFLSLPPRQPPTAGIAFGEPSLSTGNASFVVQRVTGGPYPIGGFRVNLVVNNFPGQPVGLAFSGSFVRITIGPNTYRIAWTDSDGDGAVGVGDSFIVSGDRTPLPPLSVYEFDLQWQTGWTAQAFWSTY